MEKFSNKEVIEEFTLIQIFSIEQTELKKYNFQKCLLWVGWPTCMAQNISKTVKDKGKKVLRSGN